MVIKLKIERHIEKPKMTPIKLKIERVLDEPKKNKRVYKKRVKKEGGDNLEGTNKKKKVTAKKKEIEIISDDIKETSVVVEPDALEYPVKNTIEDVDGLQKIQEGEVNLIEYNISIPEDLIESKMENYIEDDENKSQD